MAYQLVPGSFKPQNSKSHGDTTFTKVFVGGLAWETRSDSLRRYFEQFGDVSEAAVVTDKSTGRSKGYGFVTFRDAEAAKRACADPTPLIDGRWANCNLASLGRPQLIQLYGHLKHAADSYIGGLQTVQRDYYGSFQQSLPYGYYPQGYLYPSYGSRKSLEDICSSPVFMNRHATYGPKYLMPPENHNSYVNQQYLAAYEAHGATISTMYQYGRLGQTVPLGHGYSAMHGYMMPGHHMMQFAGLGVNGTATSTVPLIQPSYPSGNAAAVPAQPQVLFPVPPVLFSDSAQIVG